jgi:hypothetical protein
MTKFLVDKKTGEEFESIGSVSREQLQYGHTMLAEGIGSVWLVKKLPPKNPMPLLMPGDIVMEINSSFACMIIKSSAWSNHWDVMSLGSNGGIIEYLGRRWDLSVERIGKVFRNGKLLWTRDA